jgi:hypothetical protein
MVFVACPKQVILNPEGVICCVIFCKKRDYRKAFTRSAGVDIRAYTPRSSWARHEVTVLEDPCSHDGSLRSEISRI